MSYQFIVLAFLIHLASCTSIGQINKPGKEGVVLLRTHFYDTQGKPTFTDVLRVWYKDSTVIEEIHKTNSVTTAGVTSITYPIILYRYIDLRSKTLYDYKSFSDTSRMFNKAPLPDSVMEDYGWSFYSDKVIQIQGTPEPLSDTVIENTTYKRAKFNFIRHDPQKNFIIGFFRCDRKKELFSLEKSYSRKLNCMMVKFLDFKYGASKPYASIEIEFASDTLSKEELKVFDVWERNAKQNLVNK